jgi:large-conductance mechanosensitive channel
MVGSVILTLWNNYTISYGIMIWIMCGFAVIAFVNSKLLVKIFAKYTPDEASENDEYGEELPEEEIPDDVKTLAEEKLNDMQILEEKNPEIPEEHI